MSTMPIRYLGWMTRDLVRGPMLWMLGLAAVAIWMNASINGAPLINPHRSITLFVLLAAAGMVSRDFAGGYHRTLFAKPVSPPLYYLQRWLLGASSVIVAMLIVAFGVHVRLGTPIQTGDLLAQTAATYLLVGGVIFFFSTITRRDWLVAVLLMLSHRALGSMINNVFVESRLSPLTYRLLKVTYSAMPPFNLVGTDTPITWDANLAHAALYGVGLVLAGLAILHWRALGAGWRE